MEATAAASAGGAASDGMGVPAAGSSLPTPLTATAANAATSESESLSSPAIGAAMMQLARRASRVYAVVSASLMIQIAVNERSVF